jgi:hypothetical protein
VIALIFQLGPLLLQLGLVLLVAVVLLLLADKVKPGYRIYARIGVLALGVLVAWALLHQQESDKHFDWEQEVRLSDGGTIWIKRQTTFGHFGEPTQVSSASSLLEEFEFIEKTGNLVQWKGQYDLSPLLLDFDQGTPYLAARIKPRKHFAWGCPPYPYVFFRFTNGQWQRIGIKSFPARFERSNVFPYLDEQTRKSLKSGVKKMFADMVEDKLKPPVSSEVRTIDRRIVNPLYFCQGSTDLIGPDGQRRMVSLDSYYGTGTGNRLGDRFGWKDQKVYLSEQEAIELGILKLGNEK